MGGRFLQALKMALAGHIDHQNFEHTFTLSYPFSTQKRTGSELVLVQSWF